MQTINDNLYSITHIDGVLSLVSQRSYLNYTA